MSALQITPSLEQKAERLFGIIDRRMRKEDAPRTGFWVTCDEHKRKNPSACAKVHAHMKRLNAELRWAFCETFVHIQSPFFVTISVVLDGTTQYRGKLYFREDGTFQCMLSKEFPQEWVETITDVLYCSSLKQKENS